MKDKKGMECVLYPAAVLAFSASRNQKECHTAHESNRLCLYIFSWQF